MLRTITFLIAVVSLFLFLATEHVPFAVVAVFNIVLSAQMKILYAVRLSKEAEE